MGCWNSLVDKSFLFLLSLKEVLRKLGDILRCVFPIVNDFKIYVSLSDTFICLLLSSPITCRKHDAVPKTSRHPEN